MCITDVRDVMCTWYVMCVMCAACHNIDQWPFPVPGQHLNLPIMGTVIQVRLVHVHDETGETCA
jgi:hypothetical protein